MITTEARQGLIHGIARFPAHGIVGESEVFGRIEVTGVLRPRVKIHYRDIESRDTPASPVLLRSCSLESPELCVADILNTTVFNDASFP